MKKQKTESLADTQSNLVSRINEKLQKWKEDPKDPQEFTAAIADFPAGSILIGPLPGLVMCRLDMNKDWSEGTFLPYIFLKDTPEVEKIKKIVTDINPGIKGSGEESFSNARGY